MRLRLPESKAVLDWPTVKKSVGVSPSGGWCLKCQQPARTSVQRARGLMRQPQDLPSPPRVPAARLPTISGSRNMGVLHLQPLPPGPDLLLTALRPQAVEFLPAGACPTGIPAVDSGHEYV